MVPANRSPHGRAPGRSPDCGSLRIAPEDQKEGTSDPRHQVQPGRTPPGTKDKDVFDWLQLRVSGSDAPPPGKPRPRASGAGWRLDHREAGGGARACVLPGRERRAPSLVRAEGKMGGDGAKLVQPLVCLAFSLGKGKAWNWVASFEAFLRVADRAIPKSVCFFPGLRLPLCSWEPAW